MTVMLDPAPLLNAIGPTGDFEAAATLDVTRETIWRWRTGRNLIDPRNADRLAVNAGTNAYVLWPHLLETAIEQAQTRCAWGPCSAPFFPTRKNHRYCKRRCAEYASQARNRDRRLAAKRARYSTDPEYRAAKLKDSQAYRDHARRATAAYDKAYREANADRIRERRRRWYLTNAERVKAAERARYHARKGHEEAA